MSDPTDDIQDALMQTLKSDADLMGIVSGVFDGPMQNQAYPYITFGPWDSLPDDTECIDGERHTVQIDIWSRFHGRLKEANRIGGMVKKVLHDAELDTGDTQFCECRILSRRCFHDPDGITAHAIVTVEVQVNV